MKEIVSGGIRSIYLIGKIPKIDDKFEIYGYTNDIPVFYKYKNIYFTLYYNEEAVPV